jgi:hypothetical protein
MNIYNKTLVARTYGSGKNALEIPSSLVKGQRGTGVSPNPQHMLAIAGDYDTFKRDRAAGVIEVAE